MVTRFYCVFKIIEISDETESDEPVGTSGGVKAKSRPPIK